MEGASARPTVAIIVPAYNAQATITPCLDAVRAAMRAGDELIVYDDGSTDRTNAIAVAAGATIIRNEGAPRGPAFGRNAAAEEAKADYLLFVDADVVISPETIDVLAQAITGSDAIAAFGSYDDRPQSVRLTSLYANLRHHFVHQQGPDEASTFWSGIGMIDRQIFLKSGGYDTALFRFPSIEDVELGVRLVSAGYRIRLVHTALGQHCKDWSLWRVWHTDVVRRAYPWAGLIADGRTAGVDLNLTQRERVTAMTALAIPLLLVASLWQPWFLVAAAIAALTYTYRNRAFFAFLTRILGLPKVLAPIAMHWCYHIYSSVTFVTVVVATKLGLRRAPNYMSIKAGNA